MNDAEVLKKICASKFAEDNGKIMRIINVIGHKHTSLKDVKNVLDHLEEGAFLESVDFLSKAGYIEIRNIQSKQADGIADTDYIHLEATLSRDGIKLAKGYLKDDLVDM